MYLTVLKNFLGGNAHGFAMRSMSLRDMQIPKSEKKNSWLPNPGDAPET